MPHRLLNTSLDWISKIFLICWAWFSPAAFAILGVFLLVMFDTILGIKASNKKGVPFSSRRFFDVVSKLSVYFIGIVATQVMQKMFVDAIGFNMFKFIVFIFASIEIVSIYENMSVILGRDIVKALKAFGNRPSDVPKKTIRKRTK